jgi:hypothetical protein
MHGRRTIRISLAARFLDLFFNGFLRTMTEKLIDAALVLGAIAYEIVHFSPSRNTLTAHLWEVCAPWVWVFSLIAIWHSIRSAVELIRNIQKEAITQPSGHILRPDGVSFEIEPIRPPHLFRLKIWGISSSVITLAMLASFLMYIQANREHHQTQEVSAPDPVVRIEPERDVLASSTGEFTLQLVNNGVDIDHAKVALDYFTAQKDSAGAIRVKRILNFETLTSPAVLRANQYIPVTLGFGGFIEQAHQAAKATFSGLSLLGVRIRVAFRRFSDQKEFSIVRGFGVTERNEQGIWSLSGPWVSFVTPSNLDYAPGIEARLT